MRYLIILCLTIAFSAVAAIAVQVDGYCYLENQTNHYGTMVLFQADSPGAVTCSTYTNTGGYYQVNVSAGAYDVYFTHQGYWGDEILDQLFFAAATLPNVTLSAMPTGVPISGALSGTLFDTTYFVTGDISVNNGQTLTIQAGAELVFNSGVGFTVHGSLNALGTASDSIIFKSTPGLNWSGFTFDNYGNQPSLMEYCLVTGAAKMNGGGINVGWTDSMLVSLTMNNCSITGNTATNSGGGIICESCGIVVNDCIISDNSALGSGGGIYCWYSFVSVISSIITSNTAVQNGGGILIAQSLNTLISNCSIIENNAGSCAGGIHCTDTDNLSISDCSIINNSSVYGSGIYCGNSNPTIIASTIKSNSSQWGGGITCENNSNSCIKNCVIVENSAVNDGGGIDIGSSAPQIANCTINGNIGGGIMCYISNPNIINTIIENNSSYGISFVNSPDAAISYNDIYNNQNNNLISPPQWVGQIVTTNANGDSCDLWMNIFADPLFVNAAGGDYHLQAGSPCIDAGDPVSPPDPDGTIADIGAFYFNQGFIPPEPDIAVSSDNLDFGLVPVGNMMELPLTICSVGDTVLNLRDIFTSNADFYTDFDPADSLLVPGDSLSLTVTFEPTIERVYLETLFIVSNAENETLTVSLQGDGGAIPDSVENLVITLNYPDAVLTWDAVTTSISGYPLTVDCYLIFYETDAYDEYEFLAYTTATNYTHAGVMQFAASMFYYVEAYLGEIGALDELIAGGQVLSREQVHQLLMVKQ